MRRAAAPARAASAICAMPMTRRPATSGTIVACKARFAQRGWNVNFAQAWGMTETCKYISVRTRVRP